MKYLLLIHHEEGFWQALTESERQETFDQLAKLRERLASRGQYVDCSQLQPTTAAARIQVRNGEDLVTDGPFAETHEQLGGYLLIDVGTMAEAIAIGKQIPLVRNGTVEVRPLVEQAAKASA